MKIHVFGLLYGPKSVLGLLCIVGIGVEFRIFKCDVPSKLARNGGREDASLIGGPCNEFES